jgi:hypothetical protein
MRFLSSLFRDSAAIEIKPISGNRVHDSRLANPSKGTV